LDLKGFSMALTHDLRAKNMHQDRANEIKKHREIKAKNDPILPERQ
jgi:hypothetical protein